jgi:hypothetical protein
VCHSQLQACIGTSTATAAAATTRNNNKKKSVKNKQHTEQGMIDHVLLVASMAHTKIKSHDERTKGMKHTQT